MDKSTYDLQDQIYRLKAHIAKLTGHAFDCEIQVDPNWKPCTCGEHTEHTEHVTLSISAGKC